MAVRDGSMRPIFPRIISPGSNPWIASLKPHHTHTMGRVFRLLDQWILAHAWVQAVMTQIAGPFEQVIPLVYFCREG
jgi:hypothetical protein